MRWSRRCYGARSTRSNPAVTLNIPSSTRRCARAHCSSAGVQKATLTRCCAVFCANALRSRRGSAPMWRHGTSTRGGGSRCCATRIPSAGRNCLQLAEGQRVLDACAAPGGKTAHILETATVAMTALDADPARCVRMARNLERLGLTALIKPADCTRIDGWWDGVPFDRVLADVPCSASGVARRHPDLKWLRRPRDVPAFAAKQAAILDALWQVLRRDGKLLYVTCSVFPQENEQLVGAFVSRAPGASRLPLPDGGPAQWLPSAEHDGFYCALIKKEA